MIYLIIKGYLWIALFTAVSIAWEWRLTGSKEDYKRLRADISNGFDGDKGWQVGAYLFTIFMGSMLWFITYWYRIQDVRRDRK